MVDSRKDQLNERDARILEVIARLRFESLLEGAESRARRPRPSAVRSIVVHARGAGSELS